MRFALIPLIALAVLALGLFGPPAGPLILIGLTLAVALAALALPRRRGAPLALAFVALLAAGPALAAPAVSITVQTGVLGDYTNTSGAAQQDAHFASSSNIQFLTGTGSNQAAKVYTEAVNLSSAASESDDLTNLSDALGAAMTCAAVKAVVLFADASNVNTIVVGNAASNQWAAPFDAATDTITIQPGGKLILENPVAAGWTVDSTHKLLKLLNGGSGSAVTGKLFILCN